MPKTIRVIDRVWCRVFVYPRTDDKLHVVMRIKGYMETRDIAVSTYEDANEWETLLDEMARSIRTAHSELH